MSLEFDQGPVKSHFENHVLTLTLANPPANALSIAVLQALKTAFDRSEERRVGKEC